jgi:hypothetical protein
MAILQCEVPDGNDFPPALRFDRSEGSIQRDRKIYLMGFPGEPAAGTENLDALDLIFGDTYGVKRWAPGQIGERTGEHPDDSKAWVLSHDASTLGGNSGSCVVDLTNDGLRVLGLHFSGLRRQDNYAHAMAELQHYLEPHGTAFVD